MKKYNGCISEDIVGCQYLRKCPLCKSHELKHVDNYSIDEHGPVEFDYYCENCKKVVAHWAYGHVNLEAKKI